MFPLNDSQLTQFSPPVPVYLKRSNFELIRCVSKSCLICQIRYKQMIISLIDAISDTPQNVSESRRFSNYRDPRRVLKRDSRVGTEEKEVLRNLPGHHEERRADPELGPIAVRHGKASAQLEVDG